MRKEPSMKMSVSHPFFLLVAHTGFCLFSLSLSFTTEHAVVHLALDRDVTNEGVPRFQVFSIKITAKGENIL